MGSSGTPGRPERTSDEDVEFFLSGRRDLRVHAIDTAWLQRMNERGWSRIG